jgi:hypothetical protein
MSVRTDQQGGFMRRTAVIALASSLSACSVLDQLQFNGPMRLDPSKV